MGSDLAAAGAGWAAAAFGGLALGAVAAGCFRALAAARAGRERRYRRALSGVFLGLAVSVAALAFLLILPPKALLAERGLWIWAGVWGGAGCLSALFPGWAGVPLAAGILSCLGLLAAETAAWHPVVPGREAARLVPYAAATDGITGDLTVPDRNAVPVLSRVAPNGRDASLEARVLELSGPLAPLFGSRRYRLERLVDGAGTTSLEFPRRSGPLEAVLGGGDRSLGWISLRTVRSAPAPLEPLRALSWTFDPEGDLEVRSP